MKGGKKGRRVASPKQKADVGDVVNQDWLSAMFLLGMHKIKQLYQ